MNIAACAELHPPVGGVCGKLIFTENAELVHAACVVAIPANDVTINDVDTPIALPDDVGITPLMVTGVVVTPPSPSNSTNSAAHRGVPVWGLKYEPSPKVTLRRVGVPDAPNTNPKLLKTIESHARPFRGGGTATDLVRLNLNKLFAVSGSTVPELAVAVSQNRGWVAAVVGVPAPADVRDATALNDRL